MTDDEKAKSLILSEYFCVGEECYGKPKQELRAIARDIQSGLQPTFDSEEVRKTVAAVRSFEAITAKDLLIDGIKWLLPPLGLMLALWFPLFWFS